MDRRKFSKGVIGTGLAAGIARWTNDKSTQKETIPQLRPRKLQEGDTVGMIAPASSFPTSRIEKAEKNMARLGLKVKWGKNIKAQHGYLAGHDALRLADFHDMVADPEVKAIWCIRGGYGCTRILDQIDYDLVREHPKIIIGYSDVTALLQAINLRTGLIGFHGPVGSSTFSDYTFGHVENVLFGKSTNVRMSQSMKQLAAKRAGFETYTIHAGKATGALVGGNLSLLAAMCGTSYEMDVQNKILFLEDIEEKPYRVDRMITQLRQTYDLAQCAGIACGIFEGCVPDEGDRSLTLRQTLEDRLGDLDVPVAYGYSFGHVTDQVTLPVGVRTQMDTESMQLTLLEDCVV